MLFGVLPIISLASIPAAIHFFVDASTVIIEGSSTMTPLLFKHINKFVVPKSIPIFVTILLTLPFINKTTIIIYYT